MEGTTSVNRVPNEPAVKRYKFLWRVFVSLNLALGVYMFVQAGKKEKGKEKSEAPAEIASNPAAVTAPAQEETIVSTPITMPLIVRQPIPDDQQREIFKWMLEEKRKVKPQNREEKKCNEEEKALLKEFIRSKPIPRF